MPDPTAIRIAPIADLPLFAAAAEGGAAPPVGDSASQISNLKSSPPAPADSFIPPALALPVELQRLIHILSRQPGEAGAMTGDALAAAIGIPGGPGSNSARARRLRALIEEHMAILPVPIAASAAGYFIPQTAEEVEHYRRSLMSRARAIVARARDYELQLSRRGRPEAAPRAQRLQRAIRHLESL